MAKEQGSEEHKEHDTEKHKRRKSKISRKKIVLLLSGLIIGAILGYIASVTAPVVGGSAIICDNSVGEGAQTYIIDNFLSVQGLDAELGNVERIGTICRVELAIVQNGTKLQDTEVFMTPDKNYLILGTVFPTDEGLQEQDQPDQPDQPETKTCEDLKKEDSAMLQAFVVSYCPYGVQMQRILNEIVGDIPELNDYIKVRYMGAISNGEVTAMHGEKEAQENLKQICIREEQADKFWDYLGCFMKEGDSDSCLDEADIDTTMLDTCMTGDKGLEYAQEDFDLQNEYIVAGSPTLILNGERAREFDFGGRTAEAVKTLLCCGFNEEPEICSEELTTEQAATSFSATYTKGGSTGSGGSC